MRPTERAVRLLLLWFGCLGAWLSQGCLGPTHQPRPLYDTYRIVCGECEGQDRFVRLQEATTMLGRSRQPNFAHPIPLSPEDWKVILTSVRVQMQHDPFSLFSSTKGAVTEAFTSDEVEYLSKMLSQAFAKAQSTEWVVFGLRRSQSPEVSEITTGAWYLEGPNLHLVLANYRYAVTMPNVRELVWENPLSSKVDSYDLVPGDYQTVVKSEEEGLLKAAPKELSIAYQPLLLKEPIARSAVRGSSASPQSPALPESASPSPSSIEERLKTLKRFREQGLITDEDYRSKKHELLNQF